MIPLHRLLLVWHLCLLLPPASSVVTASLHPIYSKKVAEAYSSPEFISSIDANKQLCEELASSPTFTRQLEDTCLKIDFLHAVHDHFVNVIQTQPAPAAADTTPPLTIKDDMLTYEQWFDYATAGTPLVITGLPANDAEKCAATATSSFAYCVETKSLSVPKYLFNDYTQRVDPPLPSVSIMSLAPKSPTAVAEACPNSLHAFFQIVSAEASDAAPSVVFGAFSPSLVLSQLSPKYVFEQDEVRLAYTVDNPTPPTASLSENTAGFFLPGKRCTHVVN